MNYIAYIVTAASIVGTVANSFQNRWCFWVWICTNTFWCVFNIVSGSYAQAILYAFNLIMAVVGLIKWRQKEKQQKRAFDLHGYEVHHTKDGNMQIMEREEHRKLHESMEAMKNGKQRKN